MAYEYPDTIIDLHTHVFNVRYVPIEGILKQKILPVFAVPLAKLLNEVCGRSKFDIDHNAIPVKDESDHVKHICDQLCDTVEQELNLRATEHILSAINPQTSDPDQLHLPDQLTDRILKDPLMSLLQQIKADFDSPSGGGSISDMAALIFNDISSIFEGGTQLLASEGTGIRLPFQNFRRVIHILIDLALGAADPFLLDDPLDFTHFLLTMLRSEKELLRQLERSYEPQKVDLFVHHMMDMEHGYNEQPHFKFFPKQVERMRALEDLSKGKLIGFTAFDPNQEDWENILNSALAQGKCGVKFYPPMGYRPASNKDPRIRKRVDKFLDKCVYRDIPIFSHCKVRGFEAGAGLGVNSDPVHWKTALEKSPNRKKLRLCFAHAGGDEQTSTHKCKEDRITSSGWEASEKQWCDTNYAKKVVDICTNTEFPNVYCEIAYLPNIMDNTTKYEYFRSNLLRAYKKPGFCDKVMYGSDWHMPSMVNETDRYLRLMVKFFNKDMAEDGFFKKDKDMVEDYKNKFFYKNALKYLNLPAYIARLKALTVQPYSPEYIDYLEELSQKI